MEIVRTLVSSVFVIFLYIAAGFLLFRAGKLTTEGCKSINSVLIYLSLPCAIIKSFLIERTASGMMGLALSAIAALLILGGAIGLSSLLFKKDPIAAFASAFANPSFFGIPLITALIGEDCVFYITPLIAFLNLGQWTYGAYAFGGEKKGVDVRTVLRAPFFVAIVIGLFFYLTTIAMPMPIRSCISAIASLNTPLAMFAVGAFLAQTDIKKMLSDRAMYFISASRLLLIPIVMLILCCAVPNDYYNMKLALLIATACPVGSNVVVYAQMYNRDYTYAVETVIVSTALSIVTIPAVVQLTQTLWL